ncbi:MAG: oxygenase MpaB family protein [Acidobacteriota bacterium]|nr:oxygenase MpaB family protein [Acidobacteriota bacterium]
MALEVPAAYRPGHAKARRSDPELADRYCEHTTIGDPLAEAAVGAMAGMPQARIHRLITAGMDEDAAGFRDAPAELRRLLEASAEVPDWFDSRAVYPGCRAFHTDSDLYVEALVGSSIVRGFTTLISKSFFTTGRLTDHGVRRLRQNIRQLIEIMMPGGLERYGEGWKLSVRIRLIHAQVRGFLRRSDEWDEAEFGVPIHAGHVGLAAANFSARVLEAAMRLGAEPTPEEREAFVQIWRYSGYLMGVPETILFRSEAEALELCRVAFACEPRPEIESLVMGNALVNSSPVVIGIQEPGERQKLADYVYRVSRALIGHELADQLNYPRQSTWGLLFYLRTKRRLGKRVRSLFPRWEARVKVDRFKALVDNSRLRDPLISYRLPPKLYSDETQTW